MTCTNTYLTTFTDALHALTSFLSSHPRSDGMTTPGILAKIFEIPSSVACGDKGIKRKEEI